MLGEQRGHSPLQHTCWLSVAVVGEGWQGGLVTLAPRAREQCGAGLTDQRGQKESGRGLPGGTAGVCVCVRERERVHVQIMQWDIPVAVYFYQL